MAQRYRCPTGKSGRRQTAECFGKSLGHHRGRQFGLWKDNRHTWHQPLAASEGPEVIYRDGYYYLFLAYGSLSVEYNTRVCRSRNIDGPYVDIHGNSAMGSAQLYPILTAPYRFDNSYGWVGISPLRHLR